MDEPEWKRRLHSDLADDMAQIARRFKNCKVTLVVRNPELADGDIVLTDDDLDEAIKAIHKLQAEALAKLTPVPQSSATDGPEAFSRAVESSNAQPSEREASK